MPAAACARPLVNIAALLPQVTACERVVVVVLLWGCGCGGLGWDLQVDFGSAIAAIETRRGEGLSAGNLLGLSAVPFINVH